MSQFLPREAKRVFVPPIKCQGIKTKLVGFIMSNIKWSGKGRWIEPFLGSGVVAFNVMADRAKLGDSNPHIVRLYQKIANHEIRSGEVVEYLSREGAKLSAQGERYYYEVRERFNANGESLDFLFLNRSCFNGVMRFNKAGGFNVPFCRKPDRFRQAYVTKIANQVDLLWTIMANKKWEFIVDDWSKILEDVNEDDFVYLDPPYIGRHTDYYNQWTEQQARRLAEIARALPCGVALSMWKHNKYRTNTHLIKYWDWAVERTFDHFYHVGSTESLRNSMVEALMIRPGYEAELTMPEMTLGQLPLFTV